MSPCNYKEYPDNWKWLTTQLKKDCGDKCELCYAPNGEEVLRFGRTWPHPWEKIGNAPSYEIESITKIVLTVHHIDGDKKNNTRQNLIVLCQKCHLRLDLGKHMANRKRSKQELPKCL